MTTLTADSIGERLEHARRIAREAGVITLEHFRRPDLEVEHKGDTTPVTVADRTAETHLRDRIQQAFAADAVLGEEHGERPGSSGFRWILDPIDGTRSFVQGVPMYGTLIGIEYGERSVAGVIELPALDERVFAAQGQGCFLERGTASPVPARVSSVDRLHEALVCVTDISGFDATERGEALDQLLETAGRVRTWGDCYGYVLVATGRAEAMLDPRMSVWDAAPLQIILEEAGGAFSDWQGTSTIHGGDAVGSNGRLQKALLKITRGQ